MTDNKVIYKKHASEVQVGSTVLIRGSLHTVGRSDIKYSPVFGHSICGEYFNRGRLVDVVKFRVPTAFGIVER